MVKKKRRKKLSNIQKIEREVEGDIKDAEKWVIERRRFFIKLGWVVLLVAILFFISKFLLR